MSLSTWLGFFVASWLISLSPGAGAISCMAAGMRYGYARAVWNIVGLQLGILAVMAIAAAGLGAILAASATAFTTIKWLGAGYLVWLGIQQWRAPTFEVDADGRDGALVNGARTGAELFLRGFLVNATNPKGVLFMLAVLPQFIDPTKAVVPQMLILAATSMLPEFCILLGYGWLAYRALHASARFGVSRNMNRWLAWIEGAGLLGCATLVLKFSRTA